MTLLISDHTVDEIFTAPVANDAMLECFKSLGRGESINVPRLQIDTKAGWLRIQPGLLPSKDFMGFKAYSIAKNYGPRYAVFLYRVSSGELLAIVDADTLTVRRTGALSGVATDYLSKKNARTLSVLGSSRQARSMVESILRVRKIQEIRIYSPNESHREAFAKNLIDNLGTEAIAVTDPRLALSGTEIVGTATGNKTMSPIVSGESFENGAHINAIGAVGKGRIELDSLAFKRASLVVVDSREECVQSSQEIIDALASGALVEENLVELSQIVTGNAKGRRSDEEITLFKSQGSGAQDIFAASVIYEIALKGNLGKEIGEVGPALRSIPLNRE